MSNPRRTPRERDAPSPGRPGPLPLDALARRWAPLDPDAFLDMNPSVAVTASGATWVAFCRYPVPPEPGRGSVWIVQTDRDLAPCGPPQLLVDEGIDPRLVAEGEDLLVAFATLERDPSTGGFAGCAMAVVRVTRCAGGWAATHGIRLPKTPVLDARSADSQPGWEKNWVPFALGAGQLGLLYAHEPWQVLTLDLAATPPALAAPAALPGLVWDYGTIRGGTPPVPFDEGRLVTFFHSSQVVAGRSVYVVGACVLEDGPPFAPVLQTATPLLVAPFGRGAERFGWRFAGSVVFPGGALRTAQGVDLVCGLDDGEVAVLSVPEAALRERLGPVRSPRPAVARDGRGGAVALRLDPAILMPADHEPAEEPVVNLARHLAGAGRTFVDVGAGPGCFAVGLARCFARVLAFEPSSTLHGWLSRNVALNEAASVTVRRTLPTRSDALDARALPDLDLLKIDAPGREIAVLSGATETLERCRPGVLVRIVAGRTDVGAVAGALGEVGYAVRGASPGWLVALPPAPHPTRDWLL